MGALDAQQIEGSVQALSAMPGQFQLPQAARQKMCLASDGKLYVADSYKTDHEVLAYADLLRRGNHPHKVEYTSVDKVHKLYDSSSFGLVDKEDVSFRQKQVVRLILEAKMRRSSDVHFRNFANHTEVWARCDSVMTLITSFNGADGKALCSTIYGSMCDLAEQHYDPSKPQDGRINKIYVDEIGLYGARVSTRPTADGNIMVLRLLEMRDELPTLEYLGYLQEQIKSLMKMMRRTTGIVIFSGPTGSGKSTSLQVLLSMLLREAENTINLLTIEDPVENRIEGAVQTPVLGDRNDPDAMTRAWVKGISNAMRLDPDVVMIGEMLDRDSAMAAIRAAMTGHQVWTTVHTTTALQILDRLRDMGVEMHWLTNAETLSGLVNQSLVSINCKCRRPYLNFKNEVPLDLQERIEQFCDPKKVYLRGKNKGCPDCGGKGYRGRKVVAECVIPTQGLLNAYAMGGAPATREYWLKKMGGVTKLQHLIAKINAGEVDPSLAERQVCSLDHDVLTLE